MPIWLVVVLVLVGVWALAIVALLVAGRRSAARELATLVPHLVTLFRGLARDARVPRGSKILLGIGVAWLVSPIDLVPEFLPVVGLLDDAIVAALILRHIAKKAGPDVIAEHWRGEQSTLARILRLAGVS